MYNTGLALGTWQMIWVSEEGRRDMDCWKGRGFKNMDLNTPNSIINESISNQKDADESQQPITEIIAQSTEPTEQQPQPMEQQKAEQTAQHQQQGQTLKPQQQTTPQMTQQQQCQQPSTDEDEEQSIVVIDPVDNEPIEIPMGKDGCVWLSTLEHAFPGAYGLKYKNPATGAKRMLSFDDSTKQFVTPPGGWSNKVFELIFRTATTTPAPAPAETGSKDVVTVTKPEQSMLGTKRRHELSPAAADGYSDDGEKRLKKPEEFNQSRADGGDPDNEIKEDLLVEKRNEAAENSKGGNAAEKQQQQSAVDVGSGSGDQVGSKNIGGGMGGVVGKSPVAISKRAQAGPALARLNKLNRLSSDMIVMGLPFDLEDWALLEYFEQFGPVKFKEIKRKNNGGSRGFGFVQMEYYADQVNALSQFKHVIGDRECQVRISSTEKGLDMYLSKTLTNKPRLFVGGISDGLAKDGKDLLREYLNEHLWRFDKSASVLDMYTKRPFRNFMFVTVSSLAAGRELVRQRDFILDGHHLEVMVAVQRGGGGGGGPAMDDMPSVMKRQQQFHHHQQQQQPQPWAVQPPRQPQHPAGHPIAGGYGGGGGAYGGGGGPYGGPPHQQQQHPPPYQPPPEMDSRWDWPPPQPQQGNGRAPPVVHQHFGGDHFVEEYAAPPMPRGGGGGGAGGPYYGGHGYAPMVYPADMASSVPLYDPREDIRMEPSLQQQQNYHPQAQQQPAPGGRGGAEWGPGGTGGSHGLQQQPTSSSSGAGQHKNISAATAEAVLAQLPQDAVGTALKMLQSIMQQRQGQGQGAAENGGGGGGGAHGDSGGM